MSKYYTRPSNLELCHHGIKGMKWGVRRFQRKDGTLTNAGKKRYNDDANDNPSKASAKSNPIERHRTKLIDKYKERGYSQEAAETAAKKRMQTEMFVAVAASVAVGVVATKAATRIGQDYFDKTLKSGKVIQNIGAYEKADFKENPFFAAINSHDKKAYANMYPAEKYAMQVKAGITDPSIFNNQIKVNKDMKVASVRKAQEIFEDKMKTDSSFREGVLSTLKETAYGKMDSSISSYEKTGKVSKKLYDRFNQSLATPEMQKAGLHKKFYSEMKSKGYDAILDINDTRYSGYKGLARSPLIIFGNDKVEKISSKKLDQSDINANVLKYGLKRVAKEQAKQIGAVAGAYAVGKAASDQMAIEQYLDEHPNSKLSDKEILKIVKSERS